MRTITLSTILILAALLLLAASCNKTGSGQSGTGTTTTDTQTSGTDTQTGGGTPLAGANAAPDFSYKTADGQTHKLSELRGKPVVINFWASWCPPCKAELPEFDEVYNAHRGEFELIAISVDDNDAGRMAAQGLHSDSGWSFTFATDVDGGPKYMGQYIPVTAFIDKQGNLVHKAEGMLPKADFEAQLAKIL